ncbi:hypothetical protein KP509_11G079600 [Ceratopteris richardii]|uniref:Kinetochore protein SPC25 n=1 Tax=Ceratopteris richardii TaxID=49495 RepID=A0A8T2TX91_CERRI|nr:hypothetical protein KP509_11G079600 [Ceratopteris richardii]
MQHETCTPAKMIFRCPSRFVTYGLKYPSVCFVREFEIDYLTVMESLYGSSFVEQVEIAVKNNERALSTVLAHIEKNRAKCLYIDNEGREDVERLQKRLQELELEQKAQNEKQLECSALRESVSVLRNKIDDLESGATKLSDIQERQNELVSSQFEELESSLEEKRRRNDLILEGIRWYEENLGFQVRPTKNNVLDCMPSLAGSKELVDELNCVNNFKQFLCNMRNMFRTEYCK